MRRIAWLVLIVACGDDGQMAGPDAPAGGGGDGGSSIDAVASSCGDGTLQAGEACEGGEVACSELAASWSGGTAPCRSDCRGWDVAACTRVGGDQWESVKPGVRDPARFAGALCNDGTPYGFAVRLAPNPGAPWVIYLQGGVYCDDYSFSCATRDPQLVTTLPVADRGMGPFLGDGLFSRDAGVNPTFAGANHVFAHYCSSDFWAGEGGAPRPSSGNPSGGWPFAGHRNVEATIETLVQRYGLDDRDPATKILFGGGSAGAFGAHLNAALAAAALPDAAADGRLLLLVDAGWMTDWDDPSHRLGAATTSDRDVWTRARSFWGATFDPACEAAVTDPVDCLMAPGWYPHVLARMPTFVQQSSIDASFTGVHGISGGTALTTWQTQVEASFAGVEWLFSGDQSYHTLGLDAAGLLRGPSGATFGEVLGRFVAGGTPERVEF